MYIPPLSLVCKLEYDQVKFSDPCASMIGMASITAPAFESQEFQSRAPIDLCCVIDKSGSMEGSKLELLKTSLLFMVDQMKPHDRICIVEFDSDVNTCLPLTQMDKIGKTKAHHAIGSIKAGSCTNISGALLEAFDIMSQRTQIATISSILLFTDGLPTKGIMSQEKLVQMIEKCIQKSSCSLFTFGFGEEHSSNCLVALSQSGGGLYYYIKKEDEIPQAFSDCLGGLLTVFAQNITLKIRCTGDNGVILKGVILNQGGYKQQVIDPNKEIHVKLGDIYAEEQRDILFEMQLPMLRSPIEKQELVTVTLEYFNVEKADKEFLVCETFVSRSEQTKNSTIENNSSLTLIDMQRNRIAAANALQQARNYADNNGLENARNLLGNVIGQIQTSPSNRETFCQALIRDLRECLEEMTSNDRYQQVGSKVVNAMWCANVQQRSNISSRTFETKSKKIAKAKVVSFK
ncbi:hypothetical protein FDP41_012124 [Naegleria fowleri]|uniref:VWFA domain-containing protein n=1 Tax=Naegleria fowleri TaxID=5763 RepID=A0A6A5BW49_NAEFO|nr:uncharacterized protein FDP41_012124 [Naegleria fowleri]KAF0981467.1 hypothetical protein FDP41_012124 [Naegleria fowleri]